MFQLSTKRSKILVFLATQDSVNFHESLLSTALHKSKLGVDGQASSQVQFYKLHGNMDQKDRTKVYTEFSEASTGVLLCTVSEQCISLQICCGVPDPPCLKVFACVSLGFKPCLRGSWKVK